MLVKHDCLSFCAKIGGHRFNQVVMAHLYQHFQDCTHSKCAVLVIIYLGISESY